MQKQWVYLVAVGVGIGIAPVEAADREEVVAELDGAKITLRQLEERQAAALFGPRNNFYEAQRRVTEQLIDELLLERQAKKEGVTVEQLLERHVVKTLPKDPTEESLRVYYEGLDTAEPYEAVRDKIVEALRQRRMAKARSAYIQSLRKEANIVVRLSPPRAPISLSETPVRGPANAPVLIVEYADYECPYCSQIRPAIAKLEQEFKGKIAYAYKDVPLPMHPNAQKAAEAAHCAGAQGKFWEYHDALFSKKKADPDTLKEISRDLRLDAAKFQNCLDSGLKASLVQRSLSEAQALGVQGTPTFFVNGRTLSGAASYERLREMVEAELAAARREEAARAGAPGSGPAR
jgi:protein-disulfide isomerase